MLNVIFAALIGGMAVGQLAPNIVYFIAGQAAFARIKRVLDRCATCSDWRSQLHDCLHIDLQRGALSPSVSKRAEVVAQCI